MKNSIIKIVSFMLSFVISIFTLTSCDFLLLNDTGVQSGFIETPNVGDGSPVSSSNICAYESDKSILDINNFTIKISYGWLCVGDPETEAEKKKNKISKFDIYIENSLGNMVLLRKCEEEFYSAKYAVTYEHHWSEDHTELLYTEFFYCHTEEVTIPAKMFKNNSGSVTLYIKENSDSINSKKIVAVSENIYYKKLGNKVRLYDSWSEWYYGESEK